jgi:hypothetical protein
MGFPYDPNMKEFLLRSFDIKENVNFEKYGTAEAEFDVDEIDERNLYNLRLHEIDIMGHGKLIRFAETIFKNHFDVKNIIQMSECDSQGRYQTNWMPLKKAVEIINTVKADDIVAKGFEGKKVGELLHQKRVEVLKKVLKNENTNM